MARGVSPVSQRVPGSGGQRRHSNLAGVRSCRRQLTAAGRREQRLEGLRLKIGYAHGPRLASLCFAHAEACRTSSIHITASQVVYALCPQMPSVLRPQMCDQGDLNRLSRVTCVSARDDATQSPKWLQQIFPQTSSLAFSLS